jgi:uncharacterized lipoprotein NlpE involved in copper resistance
MKKLTVALMSVAAMFWLFGCDIEEEAENIVEDTIEGEIAEETTDDDTCTATISGSLIGDSFVAVQSDIEFTSAGFVITVTQADVDIELSEETSTWSRTLTITVTDFDPEVDLDTELETLSDDVSVDEFEGAFIADITYVEVDEEGDTYESDEATGTIEVTTYDDEEGVLEGSFSAEITMADTDAYTEAVSLEGGSFSIDEED